MLSSGAHERNVPGPIKPGGWPGIPVAVIGGMADVAELDVGSRVELVATVEVARVAG